MATTKVEFNQDYFGRIKDNITRVFDDLLNRLSTRKEYILERVRDIEEEYLASNRKRSNTIDELKKLQKDGEEIGMIENENFSLIEAVNQIYETTIKDLSGTIPMPDVTINFPFLNELVTMIEELGEVKESQTRDSLYEELPNLAVGNCGKGKRQFCSPRGIVLDEEKGDIFVADRDNSRIQVMNYIGEYISEFGKGELKSPYGIAMTDYHIFITDTFYHAVFKYSKSSPNKLEAIAGKKGKLEGELNNPRGISIDTNGDVYIAEYWNSRVSVFTKNLEFIKSIGKGLVYPKDVKLTKSSVVVLDWSSNCINYFNRNGDHISSSVTRGYQQNCLVHEPFFFCLDESENIILTDRLNHCIKIISKSGKLIQTIGKKGKDKGQLNKPKGIYITKTGKIFVTSQNPKYAIQAFEYINR
ncbi:hypothetical protein LOD99_14665 [Oopsacas minuta]|uniref:Uncharacterized protein n=1 Tax=Oopsacas minuta TaxID=111878 RepID=A0AAV7KEE4_9METZ|nr:hypothetical protein LOD99_14665 [Oopsacas minuta]